MRITRVTLTNIKSHKDSSAEFEQGVNAIIGPNGSGKSTILEAIGYCLFNSLPYKVTHFVKNGEKQGEIEVWIEHNGEDYLYKRQVGGREPYYKVKGGEGGSTTLADGVEGVQSFTKQLLGLSEDVKLESIFEDAIGVQQGLLTAPFYLTPTKRKAIFQPLFDIDIYRKCFEALRPVESMLNDLATKHGHESEKKWLQVSKIDDAINDYEERQEKIDELKNPLARLEKEMANQKMKVDDKRERLRAKRDAEILYSKIAREQEDLERINDKLSEVSNKKAKLLKLSIHIKNRPKYTTLDDKMKETFTHRASVSDRLQDVKKSLPELEEAVEQFDLSEMDDVKAVADELDERDKSLKKATEERATATEKHRIAENVRKRAVEGVCPILRVDCTDLECFAPEARENANTANENRKAATRAERDAKTAVKEAKQAQKRLTQLENDAAMLQAYERELKKAEANRDKLLAEYNELGEKYHRIQKKRNELRYDEDDYAKALSIQKQLEDEWDEETLLSGKSLSQAIIEQATKERDEALKIADGVTEDDLEKVQLAFSLVKEQVDKITGAVEELEKQQPPEKNYEMWLKKIEEVKQEATTLETTKRNEELALELVKEMRRVFNSMGPEIMEMLLDAINIEANEYHHALTGSPDLLFWSRDFEASIRNADGKRIFKQLSGGQQMVVAIALRLAVLKHLGNLPIVFLDEPTANLDEERREVLASVVGNIMGFEQVFVISHGDEFSSEIDNVIQLGT